jgi:SAM-dependent methyltransferase
VHGLVNLFVRACAREGPALDPVVEVGSFQAAGQEAIADLRPYFPDREYIGVDMRPGPGVDRVEDVRSLSFADRSIGVLLMLETLEHVADPARALAEVRRTVRPGGMVVISMPFDLHIHGFPEDYWRFTPEACNLMLAPIGPRLTGSLGPAKDPLFVFGVAFPGAEAADARAMAGALVRRFRGEMESHPWVIRERRRRSLARWLAAAAPFAEVRRVYRARARLFETRFRFHTDGESCEIA